MKAIIHRDKQTKKIVNEIDEYGRLEKAGKTEAEIVSVVEEYNKREDCPQSRRGASGDGAAGIRKNLCYYRGSKYG